MEIAFNILFVEDNSTQAKSYKEGIEAYNATVPGLITVTHCSHPKHLDEFLKKAPFDLVLADLFYHDDALGKVRSHLSEIVTIVDAHDKRLPIVALSGFEKFADAMKYEQRLMDILNKSTALPEYVGWRISKIYMEITRQRKASLLTKKVGDAVSKLPDEAPRLLGRMVDGYRRGETEREQVDGVRAIVGQLGRLYGYYDETKKLFTAVERMEPILMAVRPDARGHLRHALNVYWLGWLLLNDDGLKPQWLSLYEAGAPLKRSGGKLDFGLLNGAWFLAGLFHDVGRVLAELPHIVDNQNLTVSAFDGSGKARVKTNWPFDAQKMERLWKAFTACYDVAAASEQRLVATYEEIWRSGLERKPVSLDHGLLSSVVLVGEVLARGPRKGKRSISQDSYPVTEAARAAAAHTCVAHSKKAVLRWEEEPLGCLLLLCDQVQTWDRERPDVSLYNAGGVESAEVTNIEVREGKVAIGINYLLPRYVAKVPKLVEKETARLQMVLQEHVYTTLTKIRGRWPAAFCFDFFLNGKKLDGFDVP